MTARRLAPLAAVAALLGGAASAEEGIGLDAAFLRAAPASASVVAGYVVISNGGDEDDALVGAATDAAGRVELHEMAMDGDVMRMREVEGGIPVPAGDTVALRPGGLHIMLTDLTGAFAAGETREVTLSFASGAEVTAPFTVARLAEIELAMEAAGAPAAEGDGAHGAGTDG